MEPVILRMSFTQAEKLAKLLGHHVFGSGLDGLYEKLLEAAGIDSYQIGDPFDDKGKNEELYKTRPMVRID